jgi:hypothetical protein
MSFPEVKRIFSTVSPLGDLKDPRYRCIVRFRTMIIESGQVALANPKYLPPFACKHGA